MDKTLKGMFSNSEKKLKKILTSYHFQFWFFSFIEVYLNSTKDKFVSWFSYYIQNLFSFEECTKFKNKIK